jgi:hypothetical protein
VADSIPGVKAVTRVRVLVASSCSKWSDAVLLGGTLLAASHRARNLVMTLFHPITVDQAAVAAGAAHAR